MPVVVKISYFPNWHVSGAKGPYRIAPNLMVVVPTSKNVHLTYERLTLDYLAYLLTFLGIAFLIFMRVRGDVRHANTHPFGNDADDGFRWDDWETSADDTSMLVDPTPAELWLPVHEGDPLEPDLSADSLVWASPHDRTTVAAPPPTDPPAPPPVHADADPSAESNPPDANL